MDLDLRKCRYFVTLVDHRNFGRAAEALFIAQPVLSRQIRRLESELDFTLVDRERREFALTAAGERFYGEARTLLDAAHAAVRLARSASAPQSLAIGFVWGLNVADALRTFEGRHAGVAVDVFQIDWDRQAAALLEGRVDVALVRMPLPTAGLEVTPLYSEPRVATLPRDHPLANELEVRIAQLARDPVVRLENGDPEWMAFTMVDPRPDGSRAVAGPVVRTIAEKLEQIAAGRAIGFTPASAAELHGHPGTTHVPVVDIEPAVVCIAHRSGAIAPLVRAFVDAAREAYGRDTLGSPAPCRRRS